MTTTETIPLPEIAKSVSEIYKNGMIGLAAYYISSYQERPDYMIEFIKKFPVPQKILCTVYNYLIREGMKPIESLEEKEKRKLWLLSGKSIPVSKALYVVKK